jgi:hypothetical protein
MKRTPAEEQMEELRRLREGLAKRKPVTAARTTSSAQPRQTSSSQPAPATSMGAYELVEPVVKRKKEDPSLAVSRELYRKLMERQRAGRSFKRRKDLGNWAAELALALPFEAHKLSPDAKAELFARMQEWARARGLV